MYKSFIFLKQRKEKELWLELSIFPGVCRKTEQLLGVGWLANKELSNTFSTDLPSSFVANLAR